MQTADTKVVVVTGASRGIGRQLALDCGRNGYASVVNYRGSEKAAHEVVAEIVAAGGNASAVKADVSRDDEADE